MTSKYGFNDGETTEERDYQARDNLCTLLNAREEMKAAGVRAIPFDRPGVQYGCADHCFRIRPISRMRRWNSSGTMVRSRQSTAGRSGSR